MMKPALLLLAALTLCGCQSLFIRKSAAMEWVHSVHAAGQFPTTATYSQPIGVETSIPLTVTFTDAHNAILDCGNDLRLRVYNPAYIGGTAHFVFWDIDGDGCRDLSFSATLAEDNTPLNALFFYRETTWESILFPPQP